MGIQTEQADLRVHVCPKARKLYAFNPTWMTAFIGEHQEFVRTGAGQPGVTGPRRTELHAHGAAGS